MCVCVCVNLTIFPLSAVVAMGKDLKLISSETHERTSECFATCTHTLRREREKGRERGREATRTKS